MRNRKSYAELLKQRHPTVKLAALEDFMDGEADAMAVRLGYQSLRSLFKEFRWLHRLEILSMMVVRSEVVCLKDDGYPPVVLRWGWWMSYDKQLDFYEALEATR